MTIRNHRIKEEEEKIQQYLRRTLPDVSDTFTQERRLNSARTKLMMLDK